MTLKNGEILLKNVCKVKVSAKYIAKLIPEVFSGIFIVHKLFTK